MLELLGVAIIIPILNMMLDMDSTREKNGIFKNASFIFNLNTGLKNCMVYMWIDYNGLSVQKSILFGI